MAFLLGFALIAFGVSFTKPNAKTTVFIRGRSYPNKTPAGKALRLDRLDVGITRSF